MSTTFIGKESSMLLFIYFGGMGYRIKSASADNLHLWEVCGLEQPCLGIKELK
jgi:hypothetical protein